MQNNTPPRPADIEDDFEEVYVEDDVPPPEDDDDLEMEEITLEELQSRFESGGENDHFEDEIDDFPRSPVQDDSILTFQQHSSPVFACDMHPHNNLCATGGEDDRVFIWNRTNGEVIKEVTAHKDTVTEVHFNHDGTYLASADMAGEILVHKIQESSSNDNTRAECFTISKIWEYSMGDMSWMRWHKAANVLMAGSEDGEIYVFRLPGGDCKILPGQGVRCEAGAITSDGKKLFASYNNGTVKLWDIKSSTVLMEIDEQNSMAHKDGSSTVACDKESPLLMSGDENGKIVFSTPNGPVGFVEANGAIECLAFSPSANFRMAASGTLHGQIAIWDHSKLNLRKECEHSNDGITKIQWISDFSILVATLQGNIIAYDARTGQRKFTLSGHLAEVYSFCYDPKYSLLLTVSEDKSAKIFKVPELGD